MIKQFIRDDKGEAIGVMVAEAVGANSFGVGYSIARIGSNDKFDENLGMTIASNRAHSIRANSKLVSGNALAHTPHRDAIVNFICRAKRYFQNRDLLASTEEKVEV